MIASLTAEAVEELRAFVIEIFRAEYAAHDGKRWMTASEAGAYLGVSARAVHARAARGRIPPQGVRHVGRRVLFDRQVIDRTLERGL